MPDRSEPGEFYSFKHSLVFMGFLSSGLNISLFVQSCLWLTHMYICIKNVFNYQCSSDDNSSQLDCLLEEAENIGIKENGLTKVL